LRVGAGSMVKNERGRCPPRGLEGFEDDHVDDVGDAGGLFVGVACDPFGFGQVDLGHVSGSLFIHPRLQGSKCFQCDFLFALLFRVSHNFAFSLVCIGPRNWCAQNLGEGGSRLVFKDWSGSISDWAKGWREWRAGASQGGSPGGMAGRRQGPCTAKNETYYQPSLLCARARLIRS
jgi:hypothetical protein